MNSTTNLKKTQTNCILTQTSNSVSVENKENIEVDSVVMGPQVTPLITIPTVQNDSKPINLTNYSETPVISTILKRTSILEGHLEKTKKKLKKALSATKEKDLEIIRLKDQIKLLEEEKQKKPSCPLKNDFSKLLKLSQCLQIRLTAVENFLKTDPYCWCKPDLPEGDQFCHCSLENFEKPDLDLLLRQINELNFEAGEIHVCQKTKQGAAFQSVQSVSLIFFANGMKLEGYPFRDYSDLMTQIFIKDILDGFFPSELQCEFPRGVIFNVCDKRSEMFNEDEGIKSSVFKGAGCKLDSKTDVVYSNEVHIKKRHKPSHYEGVKLKKEKHNLQSNNNSADGTSTQVVELNKQMYKRKLSESKGRDCFMLDGNGGGDCSFKYRYNNEKSILPDITIKDGQVFNNKMDENKFFKQSSHGSALRIKYLNPDNNASVSSSSVQLKIRSINDKDLYILAMEVNEPISKLRSFLPEDIRDCNIMHYRGSLNRVYLTDDNLTLKDYGIMKNSVLLLSKRKISNE